MKLSSIISLSIFVAVTSGCALNPSSNTLVVLQHPDTKETKECKASTWALWNASAEVDTCVKTYEKSGFKKIGAS